MSVFNNDGASDVTPQLSAGEQSPDPARDQPRELRVGLHQLLLHGLPLEVQAAIVQGLGWQSLGLLRLSLWRFGEERAGELLREAGLGVSSLSWAGGFTGTVGLTFREAVADGRQALREAVAVGAATLVVAPGGRGGHTLRHAQRVAVDGLKFLADEAAARRVRLALKCDVSSRRPRWTCVQTLETAAQILHRVDSSWLGLACPVQHLNVETLRVLESLADRVWLAWSNLPCEGSGDVGALDRWQHRASAALEALLRGGFRGEWEFRPDSVTDRCTLPATHWPHVRAAVAAVRQGLSNFSAVESGRRPQAW